MILQLSTLTGIASEKLDDNQSVGNYGLDSMMTTEFRNWVFKEFRVNLRHLELLSTGLAISCLIDLVHEQISKAVSVS
jgi:hypothetical protein